MKSRWIARDRKRFLLELAVFLALSTLLSCGADGTIELGAGGYEAGIHGGRKGGMVQTARVNFFFDNEMVNLCTGTLVAPNILLTAAHCLYFESELSARLVSGTVTVNVNGSDITQPLDLNRMKIHPAFYTQRDTDAALVGLEVPIELPIPTPYVSFATSPMKLFSWYWYNGRTQDDSCSDTEIYHQSLQVFYRTKDFLYAYCRDVFSEDGDSGGPLFLESELPNDGMGGTAGAPVLYGLVWGTQTRDRWVCKFTRLDTINDWIKQNVLDDEPPCSSWDGKLEECNQHSYGLKQDCAYVSCRDRCVPRGTSYCEAGCVEYCP